MSHRLEPLYNYPGPFPIRAEVYTDPDIQPSKSVYAGKTIDVNSNVKKVSFEEITKTLEEDNIKYTYNIEFVDKDWNMSKEQFDELYRQHNKWKNMRF